MTAETKSAAIALDVRPILAAGEEPFTLIMQTAGRVPPGGVLELTAPFEPLPLYRVMSEKGFGHATEPRGPAEWVVRFTNLGITPGTTVQGVYEPFPSTAAVFARHGIDLGGGSKRLLDAAVAHGVEPGTLLGQLQDAALTRA